MLMAFASAWAEGDITGLKIEMNDESQGYVQILFTDSPVVTHDLTEAQLVIKADGIDEVKISMTDIKDMKFLDVEQTITGIENLFPQIEKNAAKGIYTIGGQRVLKMHDMKKGNIYIINGNKVMVK